MNLKRTIGVLVGVGALTASILGGGAAAADEPVSSAGIAVEGPGDDTIQFPDGSYVKFPAGSLVVNVTERGSSTTLPDGTTIDARVQTAGGISSRAVAAPVTIWYSRAAVEEMWRAKNNINNVCRILPLSYFGSLGCSAPGNLSDALDKAHYQSKRIKALYYQCIGATYCSYYTYTVAA